MTLLEARTPGVRDVASNELIARVDRTGLRGRGGAGFPLARKLEAVRVNAAGGEAFAIANAYDADPDSPLSRTLLERNPGLVLDGLELAARCVGATNAYLYIHPKAESAKASAGRALTSRKTDGVTIQIVEGPGGFMGGEESALLAVLESRRAMARQRPPYPAAQGLMLRPTLVASAETLAWLPLIAADGATADTKLVSLIGVARPGVYEAKLGTTLDEVMSLGGGAIGKPKALHVGGPTGGLLQAAKGRSVRLGFEELRAAGTHMGSAQVRAIGADVCVVNEAARLFDYLAKESCGICVPCRVGTKRVQGILEGVYSGLGRADDLPWLDELADHLDRFSLCGFGITSASIIRTARTEFAEDFRAHIEDGRCATGTCTPARARRYETMVQP